MVRPPDATRRERLVQDAAEDEMVWSDEARTQIGVQVTAVLLASAVYMVKDSWRPATVAALGVYGSLTFAAQRQREAVLRRQLAPALQVLIAASLTCAASLASEEKREAWWRTAAGAAYVLEAAGWHQPTADLIEHAFPRFQRQLFSVLVAGTYWGLPQLYTFAERLEFEALAAGAPPGAPAVAEASGENLAGKLAGALLYGGTACLLVVSATIWYRMYRLAPELFRVFGLVLAAGIAAGAALFASGSGEVGALAGSTATSFAAMAHLALEFDPWARRTICGLACAGYVCFAMLPLEKLAGVIVGVLLGAKVQFVRDLSSLRSRPRSSARVPGNDAGLLLPAVVV